jgi:hypothetical protein
VTIPLTVLAVGLIMLIVERRVEARLHHDNYANLPLWDMLFGTFRNARVWDGRCGFGDGREDRLIEFLYGRDISSATRSGGSA